MFLRVHNFFVPSHAVSSMPYRYSSRGKGPVRITFNLSNKGFCVFYKNILYLTIMLYFKQILSYMYDRIVKQPEPVESLILRYNGVMNRYIQAAFRKCYGRYNDLICPHNLPLDHMLSDMCHTNR
jgi:hypothetical protein